MKGIYIFFLLLVAFSINLFAEIKLIQVKVMDDPDPKSSYSFVAMEGEFPMNDQTSYVLPVKNRRIEGMMMPIIKNFGVEVLLVGPFLDMCGDIQIIASDNKVVSTIKPSSFVKKGKKKFWFPTELRSREEGYVHFKIPANTIKNIKTNTFKIKVGPIDNLDIVDCKLATRYEIQAILFTSNPAPAREMVNEPNNVRTVKNTFEPERNYQVKIKLRGGSLSSDKYGFNKISANINSLLYNFSYSGLNKCYGELKVLSTPTTTKLIENNDAIVFNVSSTTHELRSRRHSTMGYMIALRDGNIGNLNKITLEKSPTFGQTFTKRQKPDSWGPYIYARLMNDIYTFGQYTDLGVIQAGECKKTNLSSGSGSSGIIRMGSSSTNNQAENTTDASILDLSYQNALIFEQNSSNLSDEFPGLNMNVCRSANDPNPKITQIPFLKAVVSAPADMNFIGSIEIRFVRDGRQLFSGTLSNINAGQSASVEFNRPENRLCITSSTSNSTICKRCGDGIQGIRHWDDEDIEIQLVQNGVVIDSITIPSE